jgi:putative phosphonate transport system ATP-binding protein
VAGEVLGIVGESGSGKTTLLKAISARLAPQQGEVLYQQRSLYAMSEADRRRLLRTEWGVVHQHPMDGLRRQVSAGGNIGERLMATGPVTTAIFAPPPDSGCRRWRSRLRALTTCPPPFPAGCSSACKSPAIW